jgi:hypothetical protein
MSQAIGLRAENPKFPWNDCNVHSHPLYTVLEQLTDAKCALAYVRITSLTTYHV